MPQALGNCKSGDRIFVHNTVYEMDDAVIKNSISIIGVIRNQLSLIWVVTHSSRLVMLRTYKIIH